MTGPKALFRIGLRRLFSDRNPSLLVGKTVDDILQDEEKLSGDARLDRDEIRLILRKKKQKDRMVVSKMEASEIEPSMTIEDVRKMEDRSVKIVEEAGLSPDPRTQERPLNEYGAYSSKLEEYIRGFEPLPSHIRELRYGLPIPNIDPEFRGVEEIADILRPLPKTPNENLWGMLPQLSGDSSYDDFEMAMRDTFNFEMDLYGDEQTVQEYQDKMVVV